MGLIRIFHGYRDRVRQGFVPLKLQKSTPAEEVERKQTDMQITMLGKLLLALTAWSGISHCPDTPALISEQRGDPTIPRSLS